MKIEPTQSDRAGIWLALTSAALFGVSPAHVKITVPVVDNNNGVRILHTKEFLALREAGEKEWKSIVRPTLIVQPNDSTLGTLRLMQKSRNQMAVVLGAGPSTLGNDGQHRVARPLPIQTFDNFTEIFEYSDEYPNPPGSYKDLSFDKTVLETRFGLIVSLTSEKR